MKKDILNIFLGLFIILIVSLSMGFNISKMCCDDSGILYLGSKVPSCNLGEVSCCSAEITELCCTETNDNSCSSITQNFHFEFQTVINYFHVNFKQLIFLFYIVLYELGYDNYVFINSLIDHVPIHIYQPEFSEIQSFLL